MTYHEHEEWPPAGERPRHNGPSTRKNWPLVIGALIAVLLICGCGGAWLLGLGNSEGTPRGVVQTPTTIKPPSASGAKKPVSISDGTWEVGVDVPAGKFKTDGAEKRDILMCYWEVRAKSEQGDFVAQGVITKVNAPGRVTLSKGQFFTTSGCADWKPV